MADTIEFELVSPERLLFSEPVGMVVVPGQEGDFGVLPRHAPMISSVRPGVIDIYQDGAVVEQVFVAGGFAEVTPQRCTVLAQTAVSLKDLSREEVEKTRRRAVDEKEGAYVEEDVYEANEIIAVCDAQLTALDRMKTRSG